MQWGRLFDNISAGVLAIAVHLVFAALLVFTLDWQSNPEAVGAEPDPLNAVVIDSDAVQAEIKKLEEREREEREAEEERVRKLEKQMTEVTEQRESEEEKLAELQEQLENEKLRAEQEAERVALLKAEQEREAERLKALEQERKAETERKTQAEEETKRAEKEKAAVEEAKLKLEAERERAAKEQREAEALRAKAEEEKLKAEEQTRIADEQRRKAEEQKKLAEKEQRLAEEEVRKAEEQRRMAEAAKQLAELQKQQAEEEKRKAEEAKLKAEEEKHRKEAELALQEMIAEEQLVLDLETKSQREKARAEYVTQIYAKVKENWRKPTSSGTGLSCVVKVDQIPGGEVTEVEITESSGAAAFDRSVLAAIYKTSPLPKPTDATVFERVIKFKFVPKGQRLASKILSLGGAVLRCAGRASTAGHHHRQRRGWRRAHRRGALRLGRVTTADWRLGCDCRKSASQWVVRTHCSWRFTVHAN